MKNNIQKNKTFFLLFLVFSFFSFSSIAKPAETVNYSAFLPTTNSSNYVNASASAYYDPADFSGQAYPLITEDIPCVDINHNIGIGTKDYVIFGPVLKLQMFLYQNEYMIYPPTGFYSYYTYDGVRNFQRDNGLQETGVLDVTTRNAVKKITCPVKNNLVVSNQNPIVINPNPVNPPVVVDPQQPVVINPYFCSLNNSYYNSQAELSYFCVNNNNQTLYTVNYDTNGADIGSINPPPQSTTQGNSIILPNQGSMTKSGYIFDGWSTPNTIRCITSPCPSNSITYQAGSSYSPNSNITLYAIWIQDAIATYDIDYAPNGADSGLPSVNTQSVNVGGSLTTASQGSLVKFGYNFTGWSTSPAGTPLISANSSYTPTSDTTLYAVWNYTGNSTSSVNNLISVVSLGDADGSFYFSSTFPVASNVTINYSFSSCVQGYLCTQQTEQVYINTNSTRSETISSNFIGAVLRDVSIIKIIPHHDTIFTYTH